MDKMYGTTMTNFHDSFESYLDNELKRTLRQNNLEFCQCGRAFDRGDVAWNNGESEYGTPYSTLEIICLNCGTEAVRIDIWTNIEGFGEFITELQYQLEKNE